MTSKAAADYRDYPRGQQRCDRCSMFRKPNDCTLVEGVIATCGWCKHWKRKDG